MEYELEFRKNGKGYIIDNNTDIGKAIIEALNSMKVIRSRMGFEINKNKYKIIMVENHGSYKKVSFLKLTK